MNTTLTVKLPKDLRDAAKSTAEAMGLPLSTVIHRQLRDFVNKGEITFVAPVELREASLKSLSMTVKRKLNIVKRTPETDLVDL